MSELAEFHFLRPLWLLALLPFLWFAVRGVRRATQASAWEKACDPELLRALRRDDPPGARWPWMLGTVGALVSILALAGPSWQRLPQPVFETGEARVLVLDLSQSMDAQDIKPSRLAEARLTAETLLEELPGGRIGIVAFAGSAFTVIPLTDDRRTAAHMLKVLATDLMPVQGGRIADAIHEGLSLLERGQALRGDLILLTDSGPDDQAMNAARAAARSGHRLWVIGIGTAEGGPVPLKQGGLLRDDEGNVVVPVLDEPALKQLANAGGGAYEHVSQARFLGARPEWSPDRVLPVEADARFRTDVWRDEGRWLLLLLIPLAALGFRRGWLAAACVVMHLVPADPAYAQDWSQLWKNGEQRAQQLLEEGHPAVAADRFRDPAWQGVAHYRAGAYADAVDAFGRGESATDLYNRGNALARAHRHTEAITAYERALLLEPGHEDARFNRALVKSLVSRQVRPDPQVSSSESSQDVDAAGAGGGERQGGGDSGRQDGASEGKAGDSQSPHATPQGTQPPQSETGQAADAGADGQNQSANAGELSASVLPADQPDTKGSGETQTAIGQPRSDTRPGNQPDHEATQQAQSGQEGPQTWQDITTSETGFGSEASSVPAGSLEQWLRQVEKDPGGLLRRKFQRLQERSDSTAQIDPPW